MDGPQREAQIGKSSERRGERLLTGRGETMSYEEYRALRRQQTVTSNPLDDYDPEVVARIMTRGVPREWPFCECGGDTCPDRPAR